MILALPVFMQSIRIGIRFAASIDKVLALVAEEKTNKEIVYDLDLSDKTVKNYLSDIFTKLNLSRRAEAAAYFARHRPSGSQRD